MKVNKFGMILDPERDKELKTLWKDELFKCKDEERDW